MKHPAQNDIEYVLVFDYPVYAKRPDEILVPKDTVVVNLRYRSMGGAMAIVHRGILGGDSRLEFTVKATGKIYETSYGTMFARRTPENLKKLAAYREALLEQKRFMAHVRALLEDIDTVSGPLEGTFAATSATWRTSTP